MPRAALAAIAVVAALGSGCGSDSGGTAGELRAVATTTHAADLVRNVGGARVNVRSLLRPGSDPHGYEPRPSDVRALADAQVVVRSGGEVDEWLDGVLESAGGEARELSLIDSLSGGGGERDPHWWQDPRNAQRAVEAIRDALGPAESSGATYLGSIAANTRALASGFGAPAGACDL